MDIMNSLQNALDSVVSFLPKALAFVAILVIGWIVAKVLRKVVTKLLARVGLDRVAERGGLRQYTGKFTVSELAGTLVYVAIWLFTLQIAFNAFGPNPISDVINALVAWLPQLFIAGVIMVVAFAIANMVFDLVSGAMSAQSYGRTLALVAKWGIVAIAAIAALNQIGIATTVTMPILITVLAMIAGVVIVGVGGGLITPMRQRWETMLGHAEREAANLKSSGGGSASGGEFGQSAYSSSQYSGSGSDVKWPTPETSAQQTVETPMKGEQPPPPPAP
jgi:hypothetical protein